MKAVQHSAPAQILRHLGLGLWLACAGIGASAQVSFPGAEGFGANATGGRGGQVIYVTNTNVSGPGSLQEALATPGPRYVVFKVGGVINGSVEVLYGDVTIAGHTAPGGITVRGIVLDEVYDTLGDANNVVIRHMRSRPQNEWAYPNDNFYVPDGILLSGASNVIVDHCSFANALDENVQVSETSDLTIQYSTLAEGLGDHYYLSGMLLNYSTAEHPQDRISIHHNVWNRVGGRMPEFSCESPYATGHPLQVDYSNNLLWDPTVHVWYNSNIDPAAPTPINDFHLRLNLESNRMFARADYCGAMFIHDMLDISGNELYTSGNTLNLYPTYSDYELFYCCNDFCMPGNNPNTDLGVCTRRTSRFGYPGVTLDPAANLPAVLGAEAGAFPRDAQDQRLSGALISGTLDSTPVDSTDHYNDAFVTLPASSAPADADNDGMPDYWETAHGLDNGVQDHNGTVLSVALTGTPGYTNLECYLHCLSEYLINGVNAGTCGILIAREEQQHLAPTVTLVPHPLQNESWVELSKPIPGAELRIHDLQGRLVLVTQPDAQGRVLLRRSTFRAGLHAWTLSAHGEVLQSGTWLMQ